MPLIHADSLQTGDTLTAAIWNSQHTITAASIDIGDTNLYANGSILSTDNNFEVGGSLIVNGSYPESTDVDAIIADGSTIQNTITFVQGDNMTVSVSGNSITFSSAIGTGGSLNSAYVAGSTPITTSAVFAQGANVTLSQSNNTITIAASGGAGGGAGGRGDYKYLVYSDGTDAWCYNATGGTVYGGTGDVGSTDGANHDAVINAALTNLTSGRPNKERVVLQGSFEIDAALTPDDNTYLDATEAYIFLANGANVNLIDNTGGNNIEIVGGIWDGNRANQTGELEGFALTNNTNFIIRDLELYEIKGASPGAQGRAIQLSGCIDGLISGCDIHSVDKCALFIVGGSRRINIISNHIYDSYEEGIVIGYDTAPLTGEINITGNIIHDCGHTTGSLTGNLIDLYQNSESISIVGNYLYYDTLGVFGGACIAMGHPGGPSTDWIITGNYIDGGTVASKGIYVSYASDRGLISGNIIRNTGAGNIRINDSDDIHITGNVLEGPLTAYESCIRITSDAERISIVNNKLRNSASLDIYCVNMDGINCSVKDNDFYGKDIGAGIISSDADNLQILNNRFVDVDYPLSIDNANVVGAQIMGNNWAGCDNNPSTASMTNPLIVNNVDKDTTWW